MSFNVTIARYSTDKGEIRSCPWVVEYKNALNNHNSWTVLARCIDAEFANFIVEARSAKWSTRTFTYRVRKIGDYGNEPR